MYGYGGTRRRRRHGGEGFDPSTLRGKEASFMKGKRQQDESEARRLGEIAHSRRKDVVAKLEEKLGPSPPHSRTSSNAGGRRRRRKTRRHRR